VYTREQIDPSEDWQMPNSEYGEIKHTQALTPFGETADTEESAMQPTVGLRDRWDCRKEKHI
jgi:hypothetical protein